MPHATNGDDPHVDGPRSETQENERSQGFVSQGRLILFAVLAVIVLWSSVVRYADPIGEKHFSLLEPGAADFSVIFDGTRVFLDGHNPYYYRDGNSTDRWQRGDIVGNRWFRVSYQPSHFLLYIPIALLTTDNRDAGRIVFLISVGLYLFIAFMTWRLVLRAADPPDSVRRLATLLLPAFALLILENIGTALSLARCQSDVINAALCWAAVSLFLRGRRFWPMFLVTSAIAIKGYPIVLGAGLFFLGLRRDQWLKVVAGVLAACAFWLLPVLPYLHDGAIAAYSHALGFFNPTWLNQSFGNLFFHISPALAEPGRKAAFVFTLLVSAGCFWHARSALRHRDDRAATLWLCLFATASLLTMIGYSTLSYIYNQILIVPGLLVFLSLGDAIWDDCGLPARTQRLAFAAECLTAVLFFQYVLPPLSAPLAALANALLAVLLAVAVGARLVRDPSTLSALNRVKQLTRRSPP
jgi:hypothetical protein